jgi:hypothetical protein
MTVLLIVINDKIFSALRIYGSTEGRIALILCYNGTAFVGRIDFYPGGTSLPQDCLWHPNPVSEYIDLHMPMSRFDSILSTRNPYTFISTSIAALVHLPMARVTWPPPTKNPSAKKKELHKEHRERVRK